MSIIKLHDVYFKPFISKDEISSIVKRLAYQVKADLPKNEIPVFVGILNGCFLFAADFIRGFKGDCQVSFVKLASYQGTSTTENVTQLVGINEDLTDRTVIILEDIIDTGNTLQKIYTIFRNKKVKQLNISPKKNFNLNIMEVVYIGKNI